MNDIKRACELVGGAGKLAELIGVADPTVSQWRTGKRPVPPLRCTAIERATNGAVTRKDLRPDDYREIWPELAIAEDAETDQPKALVTPIPAATETIANAPTPESARGLSHAP